jgi:SAM-dependent methyltransferase
MPSNTIYDHPLYYDILFGWDRSLEAEFYDRVFRHHEVAAGGRVLEVACGTGRVACLLAQRGWNVTGLDVRPGMVAFARARAASAGTRIETLCADMTLFSAEVEFAAAYNPMSSFRLLEGDTAVEAHLERMAVALAPGGVYVLDMDFVASIEDPAITTDESWEMTRDGVTVRAHDDCIHVDDQGEARVLRWGPEGHLRGYTSASFSERVAAVRNLRIESWHPESSRATGVSEFRIDVCAAPPVVGRTMVVLRRS